MGDIAVAFVAADEAFGGVKGHLLDGRIDVSANCRGIFVRINFEIAKVAPLPTKGDVQIDPQRRLWGRGPFQGSQQLANAFWFPKRKGRIVGDKIIADGGFLLDRRGQRPFRCGGGDAHVGCSGEGAAR